MSGTVGNFSVAEGVDLVASGYASHAEGSGTTASGNWSHAEGSGTTASQGYSHAEGKDTTASGYSGHAEGEETTASGSYSHAEGYNTIASNYGAHAEGYYTEAKGWGSHAEGYHTIASDTMGQSVRGKYNVEDTSGNYMDIVGGGDANGRKNLSALRYNGDYRVKGDVYIKCNDDSTGGLKALAREQLASMFSEAGINVTNVSVPANAHTAIEGTASKSGYYPLVISRVNSSGTGSASCPIVRFGLTNRAEGSVDYSVVIRNVTGTALTVTVAIYIMWVNLS